MVGIDVREITAELAFPLRRSMLRPMLPPSASRYDGDADDGALHLGAFDGHDRDRRLLGVASFVPRNEDGEIAASIYRLRGMAAVVRNHGVGTALVEHGLRELGARGALRVWCEGRTAAAGFYERLGFRRVGEEFVNPGTGPHFRFIIDLTPPRAVDAPMK
jgi:GNAT superfamily N-acetyltransferase